MSPSRIAIALFVSMLLGTSASLWAEDGTPQVAAVTLKQLDESPEKYDGKLIRFEGVVRGTQETGARHSLHLDGWDGVPITCAGNPPVSKGDRVRVTGKFTYHPRTFVPYRIRVDPPSGKVEKLPAEKQGR
jgi:hypothetical protein